MDKRTKMVTLWGILMLGYLCHTLTDMMPLFFGVDIKVDGMDASMLTAMTTFMTGACFFIPVIATLCLLYSSARWVCLTERVLAIIYLVLNVFHLSDLVMNFATAQLLVLPLQVIICVLLVKESFKLQPSSSEER